MDYEDTYKSIKSLFLEEYCLNTEGPWEIRTSILTMLSLKHELPLKYTSTVWLDLVNELCPVSLKIPIDFNVIEKICEIDCNIDFIYAIGLDIESKRYLRLSNISIAAMLRLAYT